MLKKETLKANAVLASLTDEQITAIETLSQNDENAVIASRIGEVYGRFDADILEVSGIAKNGTEKTYDYTKRVISEMKTKAGGIDALSTEITTLKSEKTRLEKAIADGSTDKEAAKQLKAVTAELEQTKNQYNDLKTQSDNAELKYKGQLNDFRIATEINRATTGLKFKASFPEAVTKQLLKNAENNLKNAYKHEFGDDGDGGERLFFHDKTTGARLNNPENKLYPFTAVELIKKELKEMGVLDEGRIQTGAGTNNSGTIATGGILDLSGAKTQAEALNMGRASLMQNGLLNGSKEFQESMDKAWVDFKIAELPTA